MINAPELDETFNECPVCRGWNCTEKSPHLAWIKGTSQNALIHADVAARKAAAEASKAWLKDNGYTLRTIAR